MHAEFAVITLGIHTSNCVARLAYALSAHFEARSLFLHLLIWQSQHRRIEVRVLRRYLYLICLLKLLWVLGARVELGNVCIIYICWMLCVFAFRFALALNGTITTTQKIYIHVHMKCASILSLANIIAEKKIIFIIAYAYAYARTQYTHLGAHISLYIYLYKCTLNTITLLSLFWM